MAYDGLSEHTQRIDVWPETGGDAVPDGDQDRLSIHLIWEAALAVIVVGVAVVLHQLDPETLVGAGVSMLLLSIAALGLITVGMSWSLRAAAPNLAVGPIAVAAGVYFTQQLDSAGGGVLTSTGVAVGAAVTLGVLLSIVAVVLHVPMWAASLVLALGLAAWVSGNPPAELPDEVGYDPTSHALYWFVGFAAASLIGGLINLYGPFRRGVGSYRSTGDPADRPGFGPGLGAMAAIIGSCLFAALGGVLLALTGASTGAGAGLDWTGLVLGAALIGGVSAYGRRGGLFGTLLGVLLVMVVMQLGGHLEWKLPLYGYAAGAILLGLGVTRLVESLGRPGSDSDETSDPWDPEDSWRTRSEGTDSGPATPTGPVAGDAAGPAGRQPGGHALTAGSDGPLTGAIGDRAGRLSGQLAAMGDAAPLPPRSLTPPRQLGPARPSSESGPY